ncbi:MAG: DUF1460 domain-containing protein [Bacteroidia bacterium]|nr:DUF1460 domain-containing protein [Bacteroidia bacterium]MDW8089616.1 DUF1460 domain-containing protein [Bacteroidia bacterium]
MGGIVWALVIALADTPQQGKAGLIPLRIIGGSAQKIHQAFQILRREGLRALVKSWCGTPYGSGGAGTQPYELLLNLEQMDCMTSLENLLALRLAIRRGSPTLLGFAQALAEVRYHALPPCRWEDRYHYLTHAFIGWQKAGWGQWLPLGQKDLRPIHYITHHRQRYPGFRDWAFLRTLEAQLSQYPRYLISSEALADWLPALQDGDIVAFIAREEGLDVSHVGIFFWEEGRPTFAHAALKARQWVFGEDLCAYLDRRKAYIGGITVFRPNL